MKRTDGIAPGHNPHLYIQLGELVTSTGDQAFARHMFELVDALVPVNRLEVSEWTLHEDPASHPRIRILGSAGVRVEAAPAASLHPLLPRILQMQDPLLIQLKAGHSQQRAHPCNLLSSNGNRRWVIGCYRLPSQPAFSLAELSFLKQLSDTLLPLVEHHAQIGQEAHGQADARADGCAAGSLRRAFGRRLAQYAVSLSSREQEVCIGLLGGGTVTQMAQHLQVKPSSIETYLKRATAKLGVSGRHGLTKWMAGA